MGADHPPSLQLRFGARSLCRPVAGLAALACIGAAACFKDLLEQPRAPVFRISVNPGADTIVAGDTVSPFRLVLTRDLVSVPAELSLLVAASSAGQVLSVVAPNNAGG